MADFPFAEHLLVYAVCVATVAEPKSVTYTYAGPPQSPHVVKGPYPEGVGGEGKGGGGEGGDGKGSSGGASGEVCGS